MVGALSSPFGRGSDVSVRRRASRGHAACCDALPEDDVVKGAIIAPPPRRLRTNDHEEGGGLEEGGGVLMYFMYFGTWAGSDRILEFSLDRILGLL